MRSAQNRLPCFLGGVEFDERADALNIRHLVSDCANEGRLASSRLA
jgi:hypothetical protein